MRRVAITLAALVAMSSGPSLARADRDHTVQRGQTLSAIAVRYGVSVRSLAAANGLERESTLRDGQVLRVPDPGVLIVGTGDTISGLARRHGVPAADLARINRLRSEAPLRVGQRLLLPGHRAASARAAAESTWGRPRRPGVVKLVRGTPARPLEVRLRTQRGRVHRRGLEALSRVMVSATARRGPAVEPRLAAILAAISDNFGGRPIHVVSGFRPAGGYTRETSRHTQGRALDIRIPGVPNTALRDFCRSLENVGCGYYPRSTFVHVDVRDESAHWVDWAGPGQAPRYGDPPPAETFDDAHDGTAPSAKPVSPPDLPHAALPEPPLEDATPPDA